MFLRKYRTEILIALAAAIIAACWLPIRERFPFDDTYITFRYAANVAHGYGIVWNPSTVLHPAGPHTEGYTNFLFMLLLVPFVWMGCDLVIVSQIIGVVAVIISAIAIYRMISNSVPGTRYSILATALFLLDPFTWMNAYSGMETSLFTMWLLVAVWAFIAKRTELAFMLATFAALTRPEGALMGMILLLAALIRQRQHPSEESSATLKDHPPVSVLSYWVSAFVLPLVLYAGWKLWYFGNLLPNSFYVKVSQGMESTFLPGRGTMRIFYTGVWYLLPLAMIAAWKGRKNAAVQMIALWCVLISMFYLFSQLIQNDYQRFTNSIEAMLMVLAGIALGSMTQKRWIASVAMIVILTVNSIWSLLVRGGLGYIERQEEAMNPYARVANVFRSIPDHEDVTLAWGDAGRLPYFSGMRWIDPVGLNTNEIAHAHSSSDVIAYILSQKPELLIIPLMHPNGTRSTWNDSLHRVLPDGHGLIGSAYPAFARAALGSTYKPIALMPQTIYDLDLLADTTSVFYPDLLKTIVSRIGKDSDFLPPAVTMK
jgi:arabinofuranosyltransferase